MDASPDSALDTGAVDALFARRFAEGLTPGQVHGVVRGSALIHVGSSGTTRPGPAGGVLPGPDHVFRIASMSKSFTAAALLLLRDRGHLDLDDAVAQYVPELVDQPPYAPDSPALTLRHLLTMSGGLLTDDPWGDRQESLSHAEFGTFLDGGFTIGAHPGTRFEYSNLGYAILGRVIEQVVAETSGIPPEGAHRILIERELLAPLGMTATRYDAAAVGPALVAGHVKRAEEWVELAPTPPGAFSAMGGLHSTLGDLARWVGGFVSAFDPAPDDHPLSKAARREMQQLHRFAGVNGELTVPAAHAVPSLGATANGYGFGLFVTHDSDLGHLVHHAGGYPGYGSRMLWHPATGLGVVTLSNATYAGAYDQAMDALRLLVRGAARGGPAPVVPATLDSVVAASDRLAAHATGAALTPFADPDHFAENVEQDVPDAERHRLLEAAHARAGTVDPPDATPAVWSRAMAHAGWVLPAAEGHYELELLLSPEAHPRIQQLRVTALPTLGAEELLRARTALEAEEPVAVLLRAFGPPVLVERPVRVGADGTELLVSAGHTWWQVLLAPGTVTLTPHPTSAYPRLRVLAAALRER
ncbi:serine hydrolase domain-containing protein [Nocardioides insulae]|uniref:serine hydrolase domain-containing protein n=1 Tax=Nocardioides insulae TaxID=394734 RepID=UPI0003F83A21|nr:serine hydrolase domain-containing protein [Nocardioides insulae]